MILALMIVVKGWGSDIALHSILSQNETCELEKRAPRQAFEPELDRAHGGIGRLINGN
jgi:hypothetical protein